LLRVIIETAYAYCACGGNSVAFAMGKRYFSPIAWLNLRRSAPKVAK